MYEPAEQFPLPTDVNSLVAFLEDYVSYSSIFGERLRGAFVRKSPVGKDRGAWKLEYITGISGDAIYAREVVFWVTQVSPPQASNQRLWVRAECQSKEQQALDFYGGLLLRMSQQWDVKELAERIPPSQPPIEHPTELQPSQSTKLEEWPKGRWKEELERLGQALPPPNASGVYLQASHFSPDERETIGKCWIHAKREKYSWTSFKAQVETLLHAMLPHPTVNRWARPFR